VLWESLFLLVTELRPSPPTCRDLSDALARLVLCRAGLEPPIVLPNTGALIDTAPERSSK
jgi:hypothetical protein